MAAITKNRNFFKWLKLLYFKGTNCFIVSIVFLCSENKENVQRRPTKGIIPRKKYGSEMVSYYKPNMFSQSVVFIFSL
jgi:hypothetical protein